jgi:hypothetical protein
MWFTGSNSGVKDDKRFGNAAVVYTVPNVRGSDHCGARGEKRGSCQ